MHSHTHTDERGVAIKCYHACKNLLSDIKFWIGVTISFPLEHFLWERVWPFYIIMEWLH